MRTSNTTPKDLLIFAIKNDYLKPKELMGMGEDEIIKVAENVYYEIIDSNFIEFYDEPIYFNSYDFATCVVESVEISLLFL